MPALLYGNCGQSRSSSKKRLVSFLPSRDRRAVTAECDRCYQHSTVGRSVNQPSVYYEVFTRPAVLSHHKHSATISNSMCRVNRRCQKAPAMHSLSDSRMHVKSHSRRTEQLKTELIKTYAKLYRNVCISGAVDTVTSKDSCGSIIPGNVSLSCSEAACYLGDCHCITKHNRTAQSAVVCQHNRNSQSSTHVLPGAFGHPDSGHSKKDHSRVKNILGRRLNTNVSSSQTDTKLINSGFLGRVVGDGSGEFIQKSRKSYKRLQKAGSGGLSSRRKTASSGDKSWTGLCVVGQSFITVQQTRHSAAADSRRGKNTASSSTSGHSYSEISGVSRQSQRRSGLTKCLQVVINRPGNCVQQQSVATSDDGNVLTVTDLLQSCNAAVTEEYRCPGKIPIQLLLLSHRVLLQLAELAIHGRRSHRSWGDMTPTF